jgi:hypothetical protein
MLETLIFGFNLACWAKECYGTPAAQKSLSNMAETGAAWVAVVPQRYMPTADSSEIVIGEYAPTDDDLRAAIRRAKGHGLKVALKPHIDVLDGTFRAKAAPKDADAWWRAHDDYILHYARMAKEEGCELYVIGTELAMIAQPAHAARWKALIKKIRQVYPGPLTYAANWYAYATTPFWKELDYIGIDAYFPIPAESRTLLKAGFGAWKAPLAAVSLAAGKPVLFTEFGCSSQKGATAKPYEWNRMGPVDLELQRAYYETFIESFSKEKWFKGVLVWGWDTDPNSGGPDNYSLTVQGKPALESLKGWFARWRGAQPRPTGMVPSLRLELASRVEKTLQRPAFK